MLTINIKYVSTESVIGDVLTMNNLCSPLLSTTCNITDTGSSKPIWNKSSHDYFAGQLFLLHLPVMLPYIIFAWQLPSNNNAIECECGTIARKVNVVGSCLNADAIALLLWYWPYKSSCQHPAPETPLRSENICHQQTSKLFFISKTQKYFD